MEMERETVSTGQPSGAALVIYQQGCSGGIILGNNSCDSSLSSSAQLSSVTACPQHGVESGLSDRFARRDDLDASLGTLGRVPGRSG